MVTHAFVDTDTTRLGRAFAPVATAHPGLTGIRLLADPHEALGARLLLAEAAERSIDAQYYMWHSDGVGLVLFGALWRAADRGVRVRLLLDDNNTSGQDRTLAALDAHPNIEVRLYNPLFHRRVRAINYLTDFKRLNRRMHNKSFTVDNQAAVVGGRNIGDEYFAAGQGTWFRDVDVMAVGQAAHDVSGEFDLYWNSPSAYPAASLVRPAGPEDTAALRARLEGVLADTATAAYVQATRATPLAHELATGEVPLVWAPALLLHDDPAKTLAPRGERDVLLLSAMLEAVGRPATSFDLVSPYFVPGKGGTAAIARLADSGVRVRILTNSLSATDVGAVHAGYAKRRPDLLRAGVHLYELEKVPGDETAPMAGAGHVGESSASLHAKTFAVDGRRLFVGSFNFDERSALLNTEMGLLIDSPVLAANLVQAFDEEVPRRAYEVRLAPGNGGLDWIERTPTGEQHYATEPTVGLLRRATVRLLSFLPIDLML